MKEIGKRDEWGEKKKTVSSHQTLYTIWFRLVVLHVGQIINRENSCDLFVLVGPFQSIFRIGFA